MKTLMRRSGKLKGILKKPKKNVSNPPIVTPPIEPQYVIPESWIWRLELGVIFASAALILFSGVMRSRMVHLEKICKDFISSKNINSVLARYEQSALNLGPIIDEKLKRLVSDIEAGQNMSSLYEELLSNITHSLDTFNISVANINYKRGRINVTTMSNRRECTDLSKYVTNQEIIIDNVTLRIQSLLSGFQSISAQTNTVLNAVRQNVVPKNFIYLQLAGYPGPTELWPGVQWRLLTFQMKLNAYLKIQDDKNFGLLSLSTPNPSDIEENIEVNVSTVPAGFSPGSSYLLKPSQTGQYILIPDISAFPLPQPKARKVKLWRRI